LFALIRVDSRSEKNLRKQRRISAIALRIKRIGGAVAAARPFEGADLSLDGFFGETIAIDPDHREEALPYSLKAKAGRRR
jgi:hypothetical protein